MWRTNDDMVRGLTRFSWVGGWVAFGCAAAAIVCGVLIIVLGDAVVPGVPVAAVGSGLLVATLGRLQKVHELRAEHARSDQRVARDSSPGGIDDER